MGESLARKRSSRSGRGSASLCESPRPRPTRRTAPGLLSGPDGPSLHGAHAVLCGRLLQPFQSRPLLAHCDALERETELQEGLRGS